MHRQEKKIPKALRRLALGVALLGLAGCYPPSALETDYGNSVRNNIAQTVLDPTAELKNTPATGLSPAAAVNEKDAYDKGFKGDEKKPAAAGY